MSKTTARIILTAALIPGEPSWTTSLDIQRKLREDEFDVSERQVQRDLNSIYQALPEDLCRDRSDGGKERWFWSRKARLGSLTGRSMSEALALTTLAGNFSHLVPDSILANLQEPISRAQAFLSTTPLSNVRHWPDKLVAVHGPIYRDHPRVEPEIAKVVTEAVYSEKRLKIGLVDGSKKNGRQTEREVDAVGLLNKENVTHLITEDRELIPLHRILSVTALTTSVRAPAREPLQDIFWRSPLGTALEKQLRVLLEVDETLSRSLAEMPLGPDQRIEENESGVHLVEVTVRNDQSLFDWLLMNSQRCRVIEPARLDQSIQRMLGEAMSFQSKAEDRRKLEAQRARREELSTDFFWITPFNTILPIRRPHWAAILQQPQEFDLDEASAGCPLHQLSKAALLDWAVGRHWIAISRNKERWEAQGKSIDDQILGFLAQWASELVELDLLDPATTIQLVDSRTSRSMSVSALLEAQGPGHGV